MGLEIKKPTNFTDSGNTWRNEGNGYDTGTAGDETTCADNNGALASASRNPDLTFHTWQSKVATYSALLVKMKWKTGLASGNDKWCAVVSVNGGSSWDYTLVSDGANRNTTIQTASVEIPAGTTLSNVQVKIYVTKVGGADGDTLMIYDVWSEGTYTTEYSYNGNIPMSMVSGYMNKVEACYSGNLPLGLLPLATTRVDKIYSGDIGINLIPNSTYILGGVYIYSGDIPLTLQNSCQSALERAYGGNLLIGIAPSYTAKVINVYSGNLSVNMIPAHTAIVESIFNGNMGLTLTPNSIYALSGANEYIYSGNIPLVLLPAVISKVDKKYSGNVVLTFMPSLIARLEMVYQGNCVIALIPNSDYELQTIKEFKYSGDIALIITPSAETIKEMVYKGNIELGLLLEQEVIPLLSKDISFYCINLQCANKKCWFRKKNRYVGNGI